MVGIPRQYSQEVVHYLRRNVTFADFGRGALLVGTIPAGSVILKPNSGVNVHTVFNSSGTDLLDVGVVNTGLNDDDFLATDLSLATLGFQALDEAVSFYVSLDTDITATLAQSVADATTGVAQIVIAYIPFTNDDRGA